MKIRPRYFHVSIKEEEKPNPSLRSYAAEWLKSALVTNLKEGTQEKYAEHMRVHWFPALGNTHHRDITRDQIKRVLEQKGPRCSRSLLLFAVSVLRACLNAAIEDNLILINPAARIGKFIGGRRRAPITVFEPKELAHLLDTCQVKFPHIYPTMLLLARTGMRLGEALALQVGDVDLKHQRAWVRRTWGSRRATSGQARITTPKSGKVRQVDLSDQLTQTLQQYLQ
jgi:integrase